MTLNRLSHSLVWLCVAYRCAFAATPVNTLDMFSDAVQALSARVTPSVVQILVTRYGAIEESAGGRTGLVIGRQQSIGSGVIVDPDGYIATNAHVISNARKIRVRMFGAAGAGKDDSAITTALSQALSTPMEATLVGVLEEQDLALIKVEATGLPALPFAAYNKLRQGQVVFAFGNREGLSNSVSLGVVSSVARQPDPDSPFLYIQTDAPINPGDSGGPLVNTAGQIVGLDTFILTQSGGSEGIGFAIPSPLIQFFTQQLRKYGHFHRLVIGAGMQTITPTLAAALKLGRESGVLISDIQPGSPAQAAGVCLNDIVYGFDGREIENLPMLMSAMLMHSEARPMALQLLRGGQRISIDVQPVEETHTFDSLSELVDPDKSQIAKLGILGVTIDKRTEAIYPNIRGAYGVAVAGRSVSPGAAASGLQPGDVIHEINGTAVSGVEGLRNAIAAMKPGDPVALFVEREGRLQYLTFELE